MYDIDMKICRCGRIHFYDNNLLSKLLDDDKELVIICSSCGNVMHIGSDKEPACLYDEDADDDEIVHSMYSYSEDEEEFTKDNFIKLVCDKKKKRTVGKIIVQRGIGVPMATGFSATFRNSNGFIDSNSIFERRVKYSSLENLEKDMDEYDKKRSVVNMKLLLSKLSDEQADVLSNYLITGLDWSDTKFANKY